MFFAASWLQGRKSLQPSEVLR